MISPTEHRKEHRDIRYARFSMEKSADEKEKELRGINTSTLENQVRTLGN